MSENYHVLARKYRPQTFADLMGQDVLVKTLKNAIEKKRIPHAILLTGVRGIGKTTTARIIARSLNCVGPDGKGTETITPCGQCQPCVDILAEKHLDVIEMDAASRTSVDDIRRVIDAAYYKPASARYKIQIIDEVHMLTKQAFNALLKTLEEPPEYTKFIFATTELNRVPDTIVSRCVRFDLKRFDRDTLEQLLQKTCQQESIGFDNDAIRLLAVAANGSARDAQSLLERAISLSDADLQVDVIRDMLGLTGQADNLEILSNIVQGQTELALKTFARLFESGAEPDTVLSSLCDLVHTVSVYKISSDLTADTGLSNDDLAVVKDFADTLDVPILTRLWQVLTKGREELKGAPSSKQAVDMILIRACYLSDQPTAHAVLRQLSGQASNALPNPAATSPQTPNQETEAQKKSLDVVINEPESQDKSQHQATNPSTATPIEAPKTAQTISQGSIATFQDLVALFDQHKEPLLCYELENHVRVQNFDAEQTHITVILDPAAKAGLCKEVQDHLRSWTGQTWRVEGKTDAQDGQRDTVNLTLRDQKNKKKADLIEEAKNTPLVKEALKAFPDAVIKDVTKRNSE